MAKIRNTINLNEIKKKKIIKISLVRKSKFILILIFIITKKKVNCDTRIFSKSIIINAKNIN